MRPIEGMSALITGGGTGIGAGTARHLLERGAGVTVAGRRRAPLEQIEGAHVVVGDVTVAADRAEMVQQAVAHGGRLDLLVNAAANMERGAVETLDEQRLLDVFHSNVIAPMLLAGLCAPHLESSRGAIVFFGSVHVTRAFPGASPYAATKGALEALTGVLAAELGPRGVRVSCVRPGAVFTELNQRAGLFDDQTAYERLQGLASAHALGRIGTVEEVAEAVAYLAAAEWTTGSVLVVDGGLGLGVTNA